MKAKWSEQNGDLERKWSEGESDLRTIGKKVEKLLKKEIEKSRGQYEDRSDLKRAIKSIKATIWIPKAVNEINEAMEPAFLKLVGPEHKKLLESKLSWLKQHGFKANDGELLAEVLDKRKREVRKILFKKITKYAVIMAILASAGSLSYYFNLQEVIYNYMEVFVNE